MASERILHATSFLKGPADPDHYRVRVGRFGDRFYTDPLPADATWPHSDATFPSISTVKKSSGQDWSAVSIGRVAAVDPARLRQIADLPDGERYDALQSVNKRGLSAAADRGTAVHLHAEYRLKGLQPPLIAKGNPAADYLPALEQFFDTYQPTLVASEFVVIHRDLNGYGYGGTPDAIVTVNIGNELYGIDFKTRTSEHGAYSDEAAQIAAGARGDYMIVETDGGAERRPLPELAGGLIISIKPDGFKVYPVDLDLAWQHWTSLHAWWVARRTERDAIGKPWAPRKIAAPGTATPPLALVEQPAGDGETHGNASPSPATLTPADQQAALSARPKPDEGGDADPEAVAVLRKRAGELDGEAKALMGAIATEAIQGGVSYHMGERQTVRRFEIARGLLSLAPHVDDERETIRHILAAIVGDVAHFPAVTVGAVLGSLSADEAATWARMCDAFAADPAGEAERLLELKFT